MAGWRDITRFVLRWLASTNDTPSVPGVEYTVPENHLHYTVPENHLHYTVPENHLHYTVNE